MAKAPEPGTTPNAINPAKPIPRLKPALIDWEGQTLTYQPSLVTVGQWLTIERHTGLGLREFNDGVDDWRPRCVQALYWAVMEQNGQPCDISGAEFSIADFMAAFIPAMLAAATETLAEVDADPLPETPDSTTSPPPEATTSSP